MSDFSIDTQRLLLRDWTESDFEPYAEMCRSPEVMQFFPHLQTESESQNQIRVFQKHFKEHGFTYFAVEKASNSEFIGFVGLKHQTFESPFTPCVDIGWRLKKEAWGQGYATEAANACVDFAFNKVKLRELYAFCPRINLPSQAVMKRIGMVEVGNFHHEAIPIDSALNPCVAWHLSPQAP